MGGREVKVRCGANKRGSCIELCFVPKIGPETLCASSSRRMREDSMRSRHRTGSGAANPGGRCTEMLM